MKQQKHVTVRRKKQRLAESMYYRHLRQCARTLIVATLSEHDGNRTLTALQLGLQRTYLLRLMKELGIQDYSQQGGRQTNGTR